ncbi:MAG TPA: hypothetical protein VMT37_02900 [Solirubrobacterales bacterium]|nr:hypothetical protein [Solirubrobacterales bacterium]
MASTVIGNTGKAQPLRWVVPLLSVLAMIVALLVAAVPARAESTEGGSGWTYSGEPETGTSESGVEHGGSVGSGGGTPEQSPPPAESPPPEESAPPPEESEYTPGYSESESEAVTPPGYEEPLEVAPIEPPSAPEVTAPVAGGVSPALVPPHPLNAEMIDGAAPLPQESAHYSGPIVSSGKILLWLAIAAVAVLLLAWPQLSRTTRPRGGRPTRLGSNGAAATGTATATSPTVFASTRPRPGA